MNYVELISAVTALVTAIAGLVTVLRHIKSPAHISAGPPVTTVTPPK